MKPRSGEPACHKAPPQRRSRFNPPSQSSSHLSSRTSSMPRRGPKCKPGLSPRLQSDPVGPLHGYAMEVPAGAPDAGDGIPPLIHYTTVYKVFAKWSDDTARSIRHSSPACGIMAEQSHLDLQRPAWRRFQHRREERRGRHRLFRPQTPEGREGPRDRRTTTASCWLRFQ